MFTDRILTEFCPEEFSLSPAVEDTIAQFFLGIAHLTICKHTFSQRTAQRGGRTELKEFNSGMEDHYYELLERVGKSISTVPMSILIEPDEIVELCQYTGMLDTELSGTLMDLDTLIRVVHPVRHRIYSRDIEKGISSNDAFFPLAVHFHIHLSKLQQGMRSHARWSKTPKMYSGIFNDVKAAIDTEIREISLA